MKKFLLSIGLIGLLAGSVFGDVISFSLPGTGLGVGTNLLYAGPMRLLSITVTANTNAFLRFFDSPYVTNTLNISAFTNYTTTFGVVSNFYTSPFGVGYTNFYTNAITRTTNTIAGPLSQVRPTIYSSSFVSNTVSVLSFGAGYYIGGGLLVSNIPIATVTPVQLNVEFEKIEP